MTKAKKLGHSIYSFVRKEDFFEKLNGMSEKFGKPDVNTTSTSISYFDNIQFIEKVVLSKNMFEFASLFQNWNKLEKTFILQNKDYILRSLQANKWKSGEKLFQYIVDQFNDSSS